MWFDWLYYVVADSSCLHISASGWPSLRDTGHELHELLWFIIHHCLWCAFWHKVVGVPNKTGPTPVSKAPQHGPEWGWASKWVKVGLRVPGPVTTAWSFISVHLHCPCCLVLRHSPGNWPVLSAVPWGILRFLPPICPHDNRNSISITWTLVSSLWQTQSDPPESSWAPSIVLSDYSPLNEYIPLFIGEGTWATVYMYVEVWPEGVSSLLPPCVSWRLNSDWQGWQQALQPAGPSCWPKHQAFFFFICCVLLSIELRTLQLCFITKLCPQPLTYLRQGLYCWGIYSKYLDFMDLPVQLLLGLQLHTGAIVYELLIGRACFALLQT